MLDSLFRLTAFTHGVTGIATSCHTNDFCRRQTVVDSAFSTSANHLCCPVVAVPSLVVGELYNVPFPVVVGSTKPILLLLGFQLMEGPNSWKFPWIAVAVWLGSVDIMGVLEPRFAYCVLFCLLSLKLKKVFVCVCVFKNQKTMPQKIGGDVSNVAKVCFQYLWYRIF